MTDAYDDGYEDALDDGHDLADVPHRVGQGETVEMDPEEGGRGFIVEGEDLPKPGTVLAPGVVIANFNGECCICGGRTFIGEVIHKVQGSGWRHPDCSGQARWKRDPETNPTAAEWLYRRGRQS